MKKKDTNRTRVSEKTSKPAEPPEGDRLPQTEVKDTRADSGKASAAPKTKTAAVQKRTEARQAEEKTFAIVGIGASAGGLEAFTQLLEHLPTNTGMGFVLVQHLAPKHESMLTELLSRATRMPVKEVQDGMPVEPNHVYVIPPNTNMDIMHGVLHLTPRTVTHGQHMPVDYFLRSLAQDQGGKAMGVHLSIEPWLFKRSI
jgi:two-component system CheB/CheR fusion protein